MALSSDLISQFVKMTNDTEKKKGDVTIYGKLHYTKDDPNAPGGKVYYVQFDGAEENQLTPVTSTTAFDLPEPEEGVEETIRPRVMVTIRNHSAIIMGSTTAPTVNKIYVDSENANTITIIENLLADKVSVDQLDAAVIKAVDAEVEHLEADDVLIKDRLTAVEANIIDLEADTLKVTEADARYIKVGDLEGEYITTENLEATNTKIDNLEGKQAAFEQATADDFSAIDAEIEDLQTNKLSAEDAKILYANIDFSNIGKAAIRKILADSGLIENIVIGDGTITGELVGVTIKGDLIEGNTVVADKLVIKGSDGLYYKLNTDGVKTEAEQTDYNSLNGTVIKAKSITASKISVDDLVAFDATIGGFNISESSIYSGVKSSVDNTTTGIYLDRDGQMAIGDGSNYLKYYKDQNGAYKLVISASSILLSASNKSVETAINEVQQAVDDIQIGGRNLMLNSGFSNQNNTSNIFYSPSEKMITFTNDVVGETIGYYTSLSEYGRSNIRNSKITLSGEYKVVSTLEYGTTNPWVGYQISAKRDDTTGGSSQYFSWMGGNYLATGVTDKWTKVSRTFTVSDYDIVTASVSVLFRDVIGSIQFRNLKVEIGNQTTDWTPAPEDLTGAIDSVQADVDNLEVGGRNYILPNKLTSYSVYNSAPVYENGIISTTYMETYTPTSGASYLTLGVDGYIPPNEIMTLSGYLKVNGEIPSTEFFTTRACTYGSNAEPNKYDPNTGYFVFTQLYDGTNRWILHAQTTRAPGAADVITFEKLKFEKGNRATDWTPATEDMATEEALQETKSIAELANTTAIEAQSLIQQLSDSISMLVTDGNGTSLMTQTEDGWTFSTADIQKQASETSENLNNLQHELGDTNNTVDILKQAVDDLGILGEYIKITTYEGEPCIELGEGDSDFKLLITNTRIMFMEGSGVPAYFNNQSMFIKKAVIEEELQQGEFVWKIRSNGNMGLVWKGGVS